MPYIKRGVSLRRHAGENGVPWWPPRPRGSIELPTASKSIWPRPV